MSEYSRVQCWPVLKILCVLLCCSAQYRGTFAVDCQCSIGRQIRILNKTSGTCGCFDCPDCPEGMGSTVECGTAVPVGTNIECVHCADRFNYSDTHGRGQCRSCSVCSNHEHIERHCDSRQDIKCGDCKSGFVREPVVKDCVPTTTPSVSTVNRTQTPGATVVSVTKAITKKRNTSIDLPSNVSTTNSFESKVDKVFLIGLLIFIGIAVTGFCYVFRRHYPLLYCSRRQSGNDSVGYTNGQDRVQTSSGDPETGALLQEETSSEHTRFEKSNETALEVSLRNPVGLLPKGNPIPRFNATKRNGKSVSLSPDNTQDLDEPDKARRPLTFKREASYDMKIPQVPYKPLIHQICKMLDVKRDVDGRDYRMFASELGLTNVDIDYLETCDTKTYSLLMQTFAAKENSGTLNDLVQILKKMRRYDVVEVIDKWVNGSSEAVNLQQI